MSGGPSKSRWEAIPLKKQVDADLAADIEKQGAYVSPGVLRVKIGEDGKSVGYQVADGADIGEIRPKMERYVDLMVTKFRPLPKKVLHTRTRKDAGPLATGVYDELKRRGWVVELGRGQVLLRGPALNVLRAVDVDCTEIGMRDFGAHEEVYPTLIPSKTLARCGYFSSFPQSVSMVTHLVEDFDKIEEFRQANDGKQELTLPKSGKESFTVPEACTSPAVCYHCYRSLENAKLESGGHTVTCVGKCFRYESTNITGLDRLWDFTMREVVFVGTESQVSERRKKGIERVLEQLERFDLEASIETANDPFFSAAYATKTYYQVRSDLKYELRLTVEPAPGAPAKNGEVRTLACGSFNLHENFFGKTFAITAGDGEPAFTGCVAWGLERWVLACFTQHGFEPSRWPEAVRRRVFG
jgi:seryl-tRNA synthetase